MSAERQRPAVSAKRRDGSCCYSPAALATVDVPGWPAVLQSRSVPAAHSLPILDAGKPQRLHTEDPREPLDLFVGELYVLGVATRDASTKVRSPSAAVVSSQASAGSRGPRPDPAQPTMTRLPGVPTADQA